MSLNLHSNLLCIFTTLTTLNFYSPLNFYRTTPIHIKSQLHFNAIDSAFIRIITILNIAVVLFAVMLEKKADVLSIKLSIS